MTQATVETLTAEVRTLVVGNRQVTLSVYNQLDWLPPSDVQPFGRVHRRDPSHALEVVGASASGTLVRSGMDRPTQSGQLLTVAPEGSPSFVYGGSLGRLDRVIHEAAGVQVIYQGTRGGTYDPGKTGWAFTEASGHNRAREDAEALIASLLRLRESWAEWSALPLIVLAGLR